MNVTTGRGLRSLAASGRFTLDVLSTCTVRSSASRDPPWNGSLRAALMDYGWPGSATELGSVVQRLILIRAHSGHGSGFAFIARSPTSGIVS
jgi:transcriptional regulator of acetoin/glycerol metabolism